MATAVKENGKASRLPPVKVSGIKRVSVTIRSLLPGIIFQGKGVMEADGDGPAKAGKHRTPEEEAKLRAHWMGKGENKELCIPWIMLYQSICKAAASFKFRGRKTMAE